MSRGKADGLLRSILLVWVCALAIAVPGGAQAPETTAFVQREEALQNALPAWQETLRGLTFDGASLPNLSLGDRRASCMEWIPTLRSLIARFSKNPALGQQFWLLSSLTGFDGTLLNLSEALQLARASGLPAKSASLDQDQEELDAIRKQLHGFYVDLHSQLNLGLRAVTKGPQAEASATSHEPGEISGHIYRADTGKPLADAVVTLESPAPPQSDKLQRTGEDGSYEFPALAPGNYWVIAYRSGFVGSVYGVGKSQNASKGLIPLTAGRKLRNIDLLLSPSPRVVTLSGKALSNALPEETGPVTYGPGTFSPGLKQFAFVVTGPNLEQVCLYGLASGGFKCVTGHAGWGPSGSKTGAIGSLAWTAEALFAAPPATGGPVVRVLPPETGPEPPLLPRSPAARRALFDRSQATMRLVRRQQNRNGESEFQLASGNSHFIVNAWYGQLAVTAPDGSDPFTIATGGRELNNFVFDPQRSLVYYPVPGRYYGAIVTFDPTARRYQATPLPFGVGLKLLDVEREGDATLAAYTVDGPCVPKASANGEDPWILPAKPLPAALVSSVCLATIPTAQPKQ